MLRRHVLKIAGAGIVLFWLIMMGLLVYREALVHRVGPGQFSAASFPDQPIDNWMGIYLGENRVGYVNLRSYPGMQDGEKGTGLSLTAYLDLGLFQQSSEFNLRGTAWIAEAAGLRDFRFQLNSAGQQMTLAGGVESGLLKAQLKTGADQIPIEWPVGDDVMLWNSMGATALALPPMKVGQEFVVSTVDPISMSSGEARVRCERKTTIEIDGESVAVKEMSIDLNGNITRAWASADGRVQRVETGLGFVLQRTKPETLLADATESPGQTPNQMLAITPTGKRPFEDAKRMAVRITGQNASMAFPEDDVQHIENGLIVIAKPEETTFPGASVNPKSFEPFLKESPFIQTDHEAIRAQSKAILEGITDPWAQVTALYKWVFNEIDKVSKLSVPSALEVLKTRQGDCNEHSVLFTALARAAGIPTRIAIGLIWSEDYKGFYYHAWPEVYVGEWVWVDPTYGQLIADATHIKLLSGDIEAWPRLIGFIGGLKIEVVDIQ